MTVIRRALVLTAIAFWLGGFAFYTAVVVPVGTRVLGSSAAQGFITRQVALYLNLTGAVALGVLAWDAFAERPLRRARFACWLLLLAGLATLIRLHPRLDALLDPALERVNDRAAFRSLHRQYLWTSTAQFTAGVVYIILTPLAWRRSDRQGAA